MTAPRLPRPSDDDEATRVAARRLVKRTAPSVEIDVPPHAAVQRPHTGGAYVEALVFVPQALIDVAKEKP